jgi:uncharacterized protein YndB with AHSA1/START domain
MTSQADARTRFGTVEKTGDKHVLRYERRLDHPVETVWEALTDPDRLGEWLAAAEELELREGGRITLRWQNIPDDHGEWEAEGINLDDGDPSAPVHCSITRLDAPHLLEYDGEQMGLLRWELQADGSGCVLRFTNVVELPDPQREQTLAGWHIHLDHLEQALAGRPVEWSTWTEDHLGRWSEIRDGYVAAAKR